MRYITRNAFKTKRYRHDRNDDLYIPDRSTFLRFEDITSRNPEHYKNTHRLCVCTCFNRFRFIFIHYIDVSCGSVSYPLKIFPSFESKRSTENREKQWKTVEKLILCSSRNFLEEVEFTDVVGSFSFYLFRINASENFNINASHISNDVGKVWRTLIRWKWRYWLTRACFLWRKISQKSVTASSMRRETVKFHKITTYKENKKPQYYFTKCDNDHLTS